MKIIHKSKRAVPPHPQVAEFISKLVNTSNDDLPDVLAEVEVWRWPRSDLNAWIKVLNKFDAILEEVIRDYDVDKLQLNAFSPVHKKTVCEILRFERLLLENSTNRKMFNSYDRLNSLLFTSDLDVLVLALNLLLRPSQQYSAQPSVSHALNISTTRLLSLAKRWPNLRDFGVGLIDIVSSKGEEVIDALPTEAREVNYSFYRTGGSSAAEEPEKASQMVTDSPDSPRKTSASAPITPSAHPGTTGAVHIHLDEKQIESREPIVLLAEALAAHSVPEDDKFELMCRIRCAKVLTKGRTADRVKLGIVRLLAIAIFGHTHPEAQAQASLFLYEPDLIAHVAELLQLDRGIPVPVQTAAVAALDALARYRSRISEVLAAVQAGVNHGTLMALLRRTVTEVGDPESTLPHSFVEALLSFVTFIASHAAGGNMVVGAGLVPLLIQVIETRSPRRLPVVSKTMQLVDNVLYSFTNAFQLFCSGRGVEVLVDRIEYEVDLDIKEYGDEQRSHGMFGSHGQLPVARSAVLKHTLRSMHRMMQSSGTAEGLRGLIDSSILKSIKKIIEYRGLFGPSVLPISINIMATFVHNEPTSLSIIQEAGLPETFYKAIDAGLEPVIEVIQAIPNAIGALCLNQTGQEQLSSRPSVIPGIFSIFTTERHLKVLQDKENAVLIGTAIDELIRHHPLLKAPVFEAIKSVLGKIEDLGSEWSAPDELKAWYRLSAVDEETPVKDEDVTMEPADMPAAPATEELTVSTDVLPETGNRQESSPAEDLPPRSHDNTVVSYIDVLGRFLEGLFQHTSHCKDFITNTDGLARLGRLTALPCLPYDFANSLASDSLVQVMRSMAEVSTNETLVYLSKLVKESLAVTNEFWSDLEPHSKLLPLLEPPSGQDSASNLQFRQLVTLHIRITLLSDVFATAGYAHGRAAIGLLQALMGPQSPGIVSDLGALHRACIWENICLKSGLIACGVKVASSPDLSPMEQSPVRATTTLPEADGAATSNGADGVVAGAESSQPKDTSKKATILEQNAKALKHITNGLPSSLAPFFQAIVKLFSARRNADATQRKQLSDSSNAIATVMLKHVTQDIDDKLSSHAYYSVMLGLISVLLVDERTTQNTLHTILLLSFHRLGGVDAIFDACKSFVSTIEKVTAVNQEDRTERQTQLLVNAYAGLNMGLHLIHPAVSSKPIFESTQTAMVMTKDKKDTDTDYFEPHNFLVRMRLAALPFLKDVWEASWLPTAPLSLSRSVLQTVLEVCAAENEEQRGEPHPGDITGGSGPFGAHGHPFAAPAGPDENRIRQLTDMGFPRSAAERALMRTRNNVSAATELLLSHPFPLPPDPEPEPAPTEATDSETTPVPAEASAGEMETNGESGSSTQGPTEQDSVPAPEASGSAEAAASDVVSLGKTSQQWLEELRAAREELKSGIGRQALRLIDEHESLVFDVYHTFTKPTDSFQEQFVRQLVDDIKAFSPHAYDSQEQPLSNRCRLLALILAEVPTALPQGLGKSLMDNLLALLLSNPVSMEAEHPTLPKWLATHLLVTEALLAMGEQPRAITIPKEGEPIKREEVLAGPAFPEARSILFDFCMRLIAVPTLPSDEVLSVLRLFVVLTRQFAVASEFVKRDGVAHLFRRLKSSNVGGSQSYVAIVLRHVVEDGAVLQHVMRQEVKKIFTQSRAGAGSRTIEAGVYLRHASAMALRDPKVFIDVCESTCQLEQPYLATHPLTLKDNGPSLKVYEEDEGKSGAPMQVDAPSSTSCADLTSNEAVESVVHFLVAELMSSAKSLPAANTSAPLPNSLPPPANDVEAPVSGLVATSTEVNPSQSAPVAAASTSQDQFHYSCFLMQCLTELLFSYDSCKLAFLSYSPKKKNQTPSKEVAGHKHRTTALHFLLFDLISVGSISAPPKVESRNRITICNWAMSVLVALCVDSSAPHELKDVTPDLVSVRKFVLEAVSRAIKDVSCTENVEARYGRLLALSDLCYRLLTVRFNNSPRKPNDDSPTHITKVMLEKNFVATLTNALSEVDLNFPNVKALVASVLKPLENLTKVAIKMSRAATDKGKEDDGKLQSAEPIEDDDDEEDEEDAGDEGREETPDLYRNSSLGMFGGEMEDANFNEEDEMEGVGEDEDEDVEMEFGEDTGSEDTSNTDADDDEHVAEEVQGSEQEWQDVEEDEDEDLVENAEEEEGEEDDEDDEDEDGEEEEEMLWNDIREGTEGVGAPGADDDGEDVGEPVSIPIIHAEGENDDPDMLSDEEDFRNELGALDVNEADITAAEDLLALGDLFPHGHAENPLRDGQPFFVPRRHRTVADEDMQLFGHSRNAPVAPPEAVTHPLLLDAGLPSNRAGAGHARMTRRSRNVISGDDQNELLQTIEELIGGGAVQLFQHIMTQGRGGGGPETIRVDVPAGTLVNLERGHARRHPGSGVIAASVRVERAPGRPGERPEVRDFEPLLTQQRWAEEAKILHGKFVQERANRISNHVVVVLLPSAVERAKEEKAREDAALAKQREEKAEEEAKAKAAEEARAKEEEAAKAQAEENERQRAQEGDGMANSARTEPGSATVPRSSETQDAEMGDAAQAPTTASDVEIAIPAVDELRRPRPDSDAPEGTADESPSNAAEGSAPAPERVTVVIHGSAVDITDTGIDPTFLEALPDDMREEVLNQHARDQRAARVERPPDSQISSEFLDALPPEIRAEIIQQERMEQARRRVAEAPPGQGPTRTAAEIDPASFIASLDPQLRQDVLLESDDGFIQSLPSHMIAEAGVYRDGSSRPRRRHGMLPTQPPPPPAVAPRKPNAPRDAILLLDKAGVTMLVRLLFFPQVSKKNLLLKVLLNLCENSKTRTEIFNLLLSILQDGTGDLASVDKSFAQMSFRPSKSPTTPRVAGKQRSGSDYMSAAPLPNLQQEAIPDLIAQRCLEALTFIVTSNDSSSLFFLTEHELPFGLRRTASKKGKGKEKQMPQTHYPIVLLLGLLDRQSLIKTSSIMESVVGLLATVTRPLVNLKDARKPESDAIAAVGSSASVPSDPSASAEPGPAVVQPGQNTNDAAPSSVAAAAAPTQEQALSIESAEEKILLANPPQIPHAVLRLIVNILTIGECSGRTFQQSLALIQHLSHVPDARDVIAQELKLKAQELGQVLYVDLQELAEALQQSQGDVLTGSIASKFSPASSDQAKLLRVLKTIDYMYSPKSTHSEDTNKGDDAEKVQAIYESFRFTPLWRRLGDCLAIIEDKPATENIATVLLPLIEALMVVCKYVGPKSSVRTVKASAVASPRSPTTPRESMEDLFVSFTDAHRKVLNLMVRNNPSLMSGSFSLLVNNPRVLDFDNKRNYFSQQLHRRPHAREHHGTLQLNVRRARVFEDSFHHLQRKTGDQIKYGKLSVRFYEEEGVDAGGVTREWFQILARQMFDPNNALFQPCAADKQTYQPNKNSWVNPEHLSFFKFVGRVIGKAIYDGRLLDAYFARSLYRQVLGKSVDYKDVEWVDPEYYSSLCWILENDPSDLDLTFSVEADEFGVNRIIPLKEGGESVPVTLENRREFVQLSAQYRLYTSIKDQIESLLSGFYEIIPKELVTIFNEQELELLISGTPDIDVDEWRSATEYNGYTSSDPVIVWWWRALKSFNRDERAKVLSFATGTSRVPLNGFTELQGVQGVQRFSIHRAYGESDRLPSAHTCFNQIDLPQFSSYEMLRQQLLLAINEGGEGFGFA